MKKQSHYPDKIFDGVTTGNPDRNECIDDCRPDYHDYDQLAAEIISTQIKLNTIAGEDTLLSPGEVLYAGQPLYINNINGKAYQANAILDATSRVCGFSREDASWWTFNLISKGKLELLDWTIPAGGCNLMPGTIYYLDTQQGKITSIAPLTGFIVQLGLALTPKILNINIETRVRL